MRMPAGRYYIGDPCYMWPHSKHEGLPDWSDFCDMFFNGDLLKVNTPIGEFELWANTTAYGDGDYPLLLQHHLRANIPVDAGMIGVIPAALFEHMVSISSLEKGYDVGSMYHMIDMKEDFDVEFSGETFYIGNYSIYTG